MNPEYKEKYLKVKAELDFQTRELASARTALRFAKRRYSLVREARRRIIAAVGVAQETFKKEIDSLVTLVLKSVFHRNFEFDLQFINRENKVECIPVLKEGENISDPKDELGGSTRSLIGFAMRIIIWTLKHPRTRPLFILDEPFTKLGKGLMRQAAEMLTQISSKLGVQFVLITHEPELAKSADRTFYVNHDGHVATIRTDKEDREIEKIEEKQTSKEKRRHHLRTRRKNV